MRDRIRARFAELEGERQHARTQHDELTSHTSPATDAGLLEALPQLPARLAHLPMATCTRLYQAFSIEAVY